MRLYKLLNESRSIRIDEEEAEEYLLKHCEKTLNNGFKIYRGNIYIDDMYYKLNPSGKDFVDRTSPFARLNIYNLLLSNLPSWKAYPKRNRSVICTTDIENAYQRGDNFYYRVVFKDNTKVGICPAYDIWDSFKEIQPNLNELNSIVVNMLYELDIISSIDDIKNVTFNQLKKFLSEVDVIKNEVKKLDDYHDNRYGYVFFNTSKKIIKEYFKSDLTFKDYLNILLAPTPNNFKMVLSQSSQSFKDREVWSDGECILLSNESYLFEKYGF
jgi:hypothetical protein